METNHWSLELYFLLLRTKRVRRTDVIHAADIYRCNCLLSKRNILHVISGTMAHRQRACFWALTLRLRAFALAFLWCIGATGTLSIILAKNDLSHLNASSGTPLACAPLRLLFCSSSSKGCGDKDVSLRRTTAIQGAGRSSTSINSMCRIINTSINFM